MKIEQLQNKTQQNWAILGGVGGGGIHLGLKKNYAGQIHPYVSY